MNLFTYPHTVTTLFKLSFKLFQKNLLGMLMLTVVLLAPSLIVGLAQWFETEENRECVSQIRTSLRFEHDCARVVCEIREDDHES